MRLFQLALPTARRLVSTGHGMVTVLFVGLLVGLELAGRSATSDLHDGLAAMVLASGVAFLVTRHRRDPIPWVGWVAGRFTRLAVRIDRLRYDHGIDLRGSPQLPRRLPPAVWWVLAGVSVWAAVAAVAWAAFPEGWRDLGLWSSYVLYLSVLLVVWAGLLVCTFAGVYVPVLMFDRWLKTLSRPADRRGAELALVCGYVLVLAAVAWLLPTVVVLGLCLVVAVVCGGLVANGGADEPAILWRVGAGRPIYAVPLRRLVAGGIGLGSLVVFALLLTACGGRLFSAPDAADPMLVTGLLGKTAAWMVPGLMFAAAARLWSGRRTDPSQRIAPTIHLVPGKAPRDEVRDAAKAVAAWGWHVRVGSGKTDPGEVGIRLVPDHLSEATEYEPTWPLAVGFDDLTSGRVKDRLERRDEIQLRRRTFRGLASLFKTAKAERGPRGGGYWFAPHWWFITGLDREEPHRGRSDRPTPPRPVGPPFHKILGPRARQHFHQVLRAVEIDMIFVEDGVNYRTFERVLRAVFELYDRHAGKRKAEDHLFRGIPKVRVMVHEYAPGNVFKAAGYKEPKFDDLSRARVLHVFRDAGGQDADADVPFDFSWEPSPALGVG